MVKSRICDNLKIKVQFLLIIMLILLPLVKAEPIIDKEVEDILAREKFVNVDIVLKDNSGINYNAIDKDRDRYLLYNKRKEINNKIQTEMISSLNTTELQLNHFSIIGRGLSGNISKEGLDKLRNNPYVLRVLLPINGSVILSESLPLINATKVWALGYTGKGETVCVIDSGTNYTHPNLGGCAQTNNISDGSCWKVIGGYDFVNNDGNPMDDNGHGTHVAGTVAANGTINGTAPYAKLVIVKATNNNGIWQSGDLEDSINWCNENKNRYNISVITMSLGSFTLYNDINACDSTPVGIAVNEAHDNGIFVDASSGNDANTTHITLPACASGAVSVGAVYDADVGARAWSSCFDSSTYADKLACFTNRGPLLDLLAPGAMITSTASGGSNGCAGSYTATCGGTSMAAPHVAGTAALLLERDSTLTPDEIETILKNSGKQINSWKRIDALNATNSLCVCTQWQAGSCGTGGCSSTQRQYTRTCNPSACDIETQCVTESSCTSGSAITVCESGCSYTVIQTAIDNSNPGDKIIVNDSRTYNEKLIMDSNSALWLECKTGAKIVSTTGGIGVLVNSDASLNDPLIKGCYIKGFSRGIYINKSITYALIENNTLVDNGIGIYIDEDSDVFKIINNNITQSGDYGIRTFANSWANGPSIGLIKNNIITSNAVKGIWLRYGIENNVQKNNISKTSGSADDMGIHIHAGNQNGLQHISDNIIDQNYYGIYIQSSHLNDLNTNTFCPSSAEKDIEIFDGTGNSGDNNRCEKPGSWDDSGTDGCTFFCDNPPSATLLDPLDNSTDKDGNVQFICSMTDDSQLEGVTLYHNIGGTWQANETKTISGVSNISSFTINNIPNSTSLIWNCKVTDNKSRSNFAPANWSLTISISNDPPTTPASLTCDGTPCFNNNTFFDNILLNCSGSIDPENDNITYFIDAYYNNGAGYNWNNLGNHSSFSNLIWNINDIDPQSEIDLRCNATDLNGSRKFSQYYIAGANITIGNHAPSISFSSPTPSNGSQQTNPDIYVNISSSDSDEYYTFLELNRDVLLWMRMDQGNSTTIFDESSYSNNGVMKDNTSVISNGYWGKAALFDGQGDYINLNKSSELQFSNQPFTVAAWVKAEPNMSTVFGRIIGADGNASVDHGYRMNVNLNLNKWVFSFANGSSGMAVTSQSNITAIWNFIVGQYNGTDNIIFVNGIKEGANYVGQIVPNWNFVPEISIGRRESGNHFNGSIDEVIIFNRALTDNEILYLYNTTQYNNNFTKLDSDVYQFTGYAIDKNGNKNYTETRTVTARNLEIPELQLIYSNSTQKIFRFVINNTLTSMINNVVWTLDTGQGTKTSQYNISLQSSEDAFIYIYNNYTSSGSYNIIAKAKNEIYQDSKRITIAV